MERLKTSRPGGTLWKREAMKSYRIAVIAGDGIGKEVIPAGISVLKMAGEQGGFRCEFTDIPWGCDYYLETGRMMDPALMGLMAAAAAFGTSMAIRNNHQI